MRVKWIFFLFIANCGLLKPVCAETIRLNDFEVKRINTKHLIEPSGLTIKNGQLYTVCDDANVIYQINFSASGDVDAVVVETLDVTQLSAMNLDLEGITVVDDEFFVVSESHHKLVRLSGNKVSWVPDLGGVYAEAYADGLFQLYNAGLESATYLGDQTFLMSVERQPRGLIEVKFNQDFTSIIKQVNQKFDDSQYASNPDRSPDLTGLYFHGGMIYALHRNAYIIHELIKDEDGKYHEGQSWSYEHIVRHPDYAYQDMQFGHAEGLAVDDEFFYLVIDNNKNPSLKNPHDKRPLLIKAKRK
ncbi:MAG: esterase-like activity of phytase family protein [Marinicella sp.]